MIHVICRCGNDLGSVNDINSEGTVVRSIFACKCGYTVESSYHPKEWRTEERAVMPSDGPYGGVEFR